MIKACFIILLVFAFTATAIASMVIAPSQIVVNSISNDGKFVKIKNRDDTVKSIISYPLENNEIVINDPDNIVMKLESNSNNDDTKIKANRGRDV